MTTRIPPASAPPAEGLLEPAQGPAAGLCATCVHGLVTVLRCPGAEAWQEGHLTSVAACHNPACVLRQVQAAVVRCDGYAQRSGGR